MHSDSLIEKCMTCLLWHKILGHLSNQAMQFGPTLKCDSTKLLDVKNCKTCPMAKMHRLPFANKGTQASAVFELVHAYLWGSYQTSSHDNKRYFLTLVDDY